MKNKSESLQILSAEVDVLAQAAVMLDTASAAEVDSYIASIRRVGSMAREYGIDVFDDIAGIVQDCIGKAGAQNSDAVNDIVSAGISALQEIIESLRAGVPGKDADSVRRYFESLLQGKPDSQPMDLAEAQLREIPDFLSNTISSLSDVEAQVIDLEKNTSDKEMVNAVLRAFHTIKGESALLGIVNVSELAHAVENVFQKAREKEFVIDTQGINLVLSTIDHFKRVLIELQSNLQSGLNFDISGPRAEVEAYISGKLAAKSEASDAQKPAIEPAAAAVSVSAQYVCKIPTLDLEESGDMICEFIGESNDHLATAEDSLLALENSPGNPEEINKIFRAFHTIKGVSSFLNLEDIRTLTHETETMMDMVRKGTLQLDSSVVDAILGSIDASRKLLVLLDEQVKNGGRISSPYYDVAPQICMVRAIINARQAGADAPPVSPLGQILMQQPVLQEAQLQEALEEQRNVSGQKKIGEILVEKGAVTPAQVERALESQTPREGHVIDQSIKIGIQKLDALIEMVGELVITGTQVAHNKVVSGSDDNRLIKDMAQLSRIIREVQDVAMNMRLVPIRPVFQKMMRLVRDVSKKSGKEVEMRLSGEDTEIDKNITDLLSDPLMHMVRNSVDHGIEPADVRLASGKSKGGLVELNAFHRGGNIVIEIRDDGGGLNRDKILKKAKEKGLVKDGDTLSDAKIYSLILEPGFSTADKITDISGRGVGMDVVKRNIEMLRGKIEIESAAGKGTVFAIKLPLTLAIIDGIILSVGVEQYIVPVNSVVEFFGPKQDDITVVAGKGEMVMFHGELYQLVRLDSFFGVGARYKRIEDATACLIESDYGRAALLVDGIIGQQQVVIKSLGEKLKDIDGVSGGTILGDGKVGLILDVNGILQGFRR